MASKKRNKKGRISEGEDKKSFIYCSRLIFKGKKDKILLGEIAFFIEKKLTLLFFGLKDKLTITKIDEKLNNGTKEERKNKLSLLNLGKKDCNMIKKKIRA